MDFRRILQWPESRFALSKAAFMEQIMRTDAGRAAAALLWDALLALRCYEDFSPDPCVDFSKSLDWRKKISTRT